jgi:NAD(P)-dependent dehydrogenase (short-subunit alcohol dehydrogenase family)
MMSDFTDRKVLITGAASGIGRAIAEGFARSGAAVSIVDRDEARGRQMAEALREKGGTAMFVCCDVAHSTQCREAVSETLAGLGGLDVLVNNAGMIRRTTILETTEEEWNRVMAVNLGSVFLFSKEVIPVMIRAGGGAIVNISSGWGLVGGPSAVSYCASKGAIVQLTRALALDHGPQNIRVNCICPGDTDTALLRDEARQLGEMENSFLAAAADRPLQRIGKPEDIAEAALYLAGASFVTGTTLVVDGGGLAG